MSNTMQVYDPSAPIVNSAQQSRRSIDALNGKVIGFIDNAKPNFNYLVDDLATLLVEKYGVASVVKHRKPGQVPVTAAALKNITDQCDAVITGSGD